MLKALTIPLSKGSPPSSKPIHSYNPSDNSHTGSPPPPAQSSTAHGARSARQSEPQQWSATFSSQPGWSASQLYSPTIT
jgi:hypothetical protein